MSQLIVRNIDAALVLALRRRATEHGRSAEAEHREILREVLQPQVVGTTFKELLSAMPYVGEDAEFEPERDTPREVEG
jgi:antitoxin FitA